MTEQLVTAMLVMAMCRRGERNVHNACLGYGNTEADQGLKCCTSS